MGAAMRSPEMVQEELRRFRSDPFLEWCHIMIRSIRMNAVVVLIRTDNGPIPSFDVETIQQLKKVEELRAAHIERNYLHYDNH